MPRSKLTVGEKVEVHCYHRQADRVAKGWLAGEVVQADHRMVAVRFTTDVFSNNGWLIPDRTLWCAHGSPNLRRLTPEKTS